MSTLSDRVREALVNSGMSQSELARAIGISPASVNGWLSGSTKSLKAETASKAADVLHVDPFWLITGSGSSHEEGARIDSAAAPIKVVTGDMLYLEKLALPDPGEPIPEIERIAVNREWFKTHISRTKVSGFKIATVIGDSMEPTFKEGDSVVIDVDSKNIRSREGCYLFKFESQTYLKRVQNIPGGILVLSDNALYRQFEISTAHIDSVEVFGRAIAVIEAKKA